MEPQEEQMTINPAWRQYMMEVELRHLHILLDVP